MLKKIIVSLAMTGALVAAPVATATVANAGGLGVGTGIYVGEKQLCKVQTSWFERYILQGPDSKWVLCKSIGR